MTETTVEVNATRQEVVGKLRWKATICREFGASRPCEPIAFESPAGILVARRRGTTATRSVEHACRMDAADRWTPFDGGRKAQGPARGKRTLDCRRTMSTCSSRGREAEWG